MEMRKNSVKSIGKVGAVAFALMCANGLAAQEPVDSVALDEVTVKASRTIKRSDGMRFLPDQKQKDASTSAYGLLNKIAIPGVRVDEIANTISLANSLKGEVQVRINDIIASRADLLSLDLQSVAFVDFIENPGVRYGKDVASVINIKTNRPLSGYVMGVSSQNNLTSAYGNENAFARLNRGKSELTVDYSFGYNDDRRTRYNEENEYVLPDNSVSIVRREDIETRSKSLSHNVQMAWNVSDFDRYVFQAKLGNSISRAPVGHTLRRVEDDNIAIDETSKSLTPTLDLYYNTKIGSGQSITANAVGTYSRDNTGYMYGGGAYGYDGKVDMYSLISEGIYENRLRPFTLSVGMQYSQKYVSTGYWGDVSTITGIRKSDVNLFSQIKGRLSAVSYSLGIGLSREYSRQGASKYDLLSLRPKLSVYCPFKDKLSARYDFTMYRRAPRLSYINDIEVRMNEREIHAGNPGLTPTKVQEHVVDIAFQSPKLFSSLSFFYRGNSNCVMQHIDMKTDDAGHTDYVFTRRNQEECDMFNIMSYTKLSVVPQKLEISAQGGIYRFFNYGGTYKHHYTSVDGALYATAYLGDFTFTAAARSGFRFVEGETKGMNGDTYYATASYRWKWLDLSLYWQHELPFNGELLNGNLHKKQHLRKGDNMNMVGMKIVCRLSKGRRYANVDRRISNSENDKNAFIKAAY